MAGNVLQDIADELKSYKTSKALDALLPTVTFVLASRILSPINAILLAVVLALMISVYRYIKGHQWQFALGGLLGVIIASSGVLLSGQAKGYFLSSILNALILTLAAFISLISRRPLAMWLSHMSHGWPMDWYQRPDIQPAYTEVTTIWSVLLIIRFILQIRLYFDSGLTQLAILNTLLSTPVTLLVLIASYIYGLRRLKQLAGPSVTEYIQQQPAPWQGQIKGF